jgi:putative SOS response-associated peptidase YedK
VWRLTRPITPTTLRRHVRSLPQQTARSGDRSHLPHQQSAAELAAAVQYRADARHPDGAVQSRDQDALRWGLVPHWAKELSFGNRCINARAETVSTTPAFRDAFKSRRCIIPASGFYEWRRDGKTKTPYAIVPADEPLFAFAGLWENWRDKSQEGAEWIRTAAIITGEPNELLAPIHNRMPVILPREAWAKWIGEEAARKEELQALLRPFPAEQMRAYPISTRVNTPKNDDAELLEPVMAEGGVQV